MFLGLGFWFIPGFSGVSGTRDYELAELSLKDLMSDSSFTNITDEELVEKARNGDEDCFEKLVLRYKDKVYRIAYRLSRNSHEAEDILQKTFLQVYQRLETFRGEAKFSTWLHRVAMNIALMHQRTARRHPVESLEQYLPRYNSDDRLARLDFDYGRVARADELMEKEELAKTAREAIDRLPEDYQFVLVLHDLEDLSTSEVARVLEIEEGAVRTRLHRARLMLRGYLGHLLGGET